MTTSRSDRDAATTPRWTRENRIRANHALLRHIEEVWDQFPDLRFGQLVMNMSREPGGFADTWEWNHGRWFAAANAVYQEWLEGDDDDA